MKYNKVMSKVRKLIFVSLVFPIFAFADAAEHLTAILDSTHTMQADFVQITGVGNNQARTLGRMFLERPGKFRWEITSPNKQLIIANAKTLWIYDADLAQVNKQKVDAHQTNNPAMLLSGTIDLTKSFRISKSATGQSEVFTLVPINAQNSIFQKVQLTFAGNELREMNVIDNLGQKSAINFRNLTLNSALASSLFIFKIPPNVDVIQ